MVGRRAASTIGHAHCSRCHCCMAIIPQRARPEWLVSQSCSGDTGQNEANGCPNGTMGNADDGLGRRRGCAPFPLAVHCSGALRHGARSRKINGPQHGTGRTQRPRLKAPAACKRAGERGTFLASHARRAPAVRARLSVYVVIHECNARGSTVLPMLTPFAKRAKYSGRWTGDETRGRGPPLRRLLCHRAHHVTIARDLVTACDRTQLPSTMPW